MYHYIHALVLCSGLGMMQHATFATQTPHALFTTQDKRTILIAASATVVTWGILSTCRALFSHTPTTHTPTHTDIGSPTTLQLQKDIKQLKSCRLTPEAAAAVFGFFHTIGILDKDGKFIEHTGTEYSLNMKPLKLIAHTPDRIAQLEQRYTELAQKNNQLEQEMLSLRNALNQDLTQLNASLAALTRENQSKTGALSHQ